MKLKITIPKTMRMLYENYSHENYSIPFVNFIEGKILYLGRIIFNKEDFKNLVENKAIIAQNNIINIPAGFTAYFEVKYNNKYDGIEMKFIKLCDENFEGDYLLHTDTIVSVDGTYICTIMFEFADFVNSATYYDRERNYKITFYLAIIPIDRAVYTYQKYISATGIKSKRRKEIATPEGLIITYDININNPEEN